MATWQGIPYGDIERVSLERVTVEGRPSCVTAAVFVLHLRNGGVVRVPRRLPVPLMYETLATDVAELNQLLARWRAAE